MALIQPIQIDTQQPQAMPVFSDKIQSTLLAHTDSACMPRADLVTIPTPPSTKTWQPVPHTTLVDALSEELDKRGIDIKREQYAVSHDGAKLFGTLDLNYGDNGEYGAALGLRTSNNKSMSIQIAIGRRVFVCDNMSFKGDMIALARKHTSRLDLPYELGQAIDRYERGIDAMDKRIGELKSRAFGTVDAERFIFNQFDKQVLPIRLFHPLLESYRQIKHNGTVTHWQLHNCFTLHAQQLPAQRQFKASVDIGKAFNL